MFGSLDVSTSGLVAQRTRLETIAANLANSNSVMDAEGNYAPYRRRFAVFATGDPANGSREGVHVSKILLDSSPFVAKWDPDHPFAQDGYVHYPNIDPTIEAVNALEASRAYEANITAAEATKSMMQTTMRLIA